MARNHWEDDARGRKVTRLLAVIDLLDEAPTAAEVAGWSTATWRELARTASAVFDVRVNPPSATSRALVIAELEAREQRAQRRKAS